MIVAAALPDYPPRSRVGAWLATHEFLAALVANGHTVRAVALNGRPFETYEHDGVVVSAMARGFDLDRAIRTADLVVSHCGDNGAAARTAARHNKPSVRFAHGEPVTPTRCAFPA